ncbi:MAG TPA: sulfatase, partial [Erythrobacter sp.]|nr:sulfatase [Erythrobacter sp.]
IVLIVDESISGHYLDINHPRGVRSGLAEARPGVEIANFGVAASATNCSAGSNLVLRFAGTRDSYRRDIAVGPSLWDYAAHAGLETVYID